MGSASSFIVQSTVRLPQLIGKESHDIIQHLKTHSDREAAIVGASIVEAALQAALRSRCIESQTSHLFDPEIGALGNYGAMRQTAFAFGLIHPDLNHDLREIGKIRNLFAHVPKPITFQSPGHKPDIAKTCESLRLPESYKAIAEWVDYLSGAPGSLVEDGTKGLCLTNRWLEILAEFYFTDEDIATPKGRYLVTVGLAHVHLVTIGLHEDQSLTARRAKRKLYKQRV